MIIQPDLVVNVIEPKTDRGRFRNVVPNATHNIGPGKFPLTTSGNSSVFAAQFSDSDTGRPFFGPVKKLIFKQLGNCETPVLLPYVNTCETVMFEGYIDTPRTVFEIISQLSKVSDVSLFIGSAEQHSYIKEPPRYFQKRGLPVCPRVESLNIMMDLEYYNSLQKFCADDMCRCRNIGYCFNSTQHYLVFLVNSLLRGAAESFPCLKELIVNLPENARLSSSERYVRKSLPGLWRKPKKYFKHNTHIAPVPIPIAESSEEEFAFDPVAASPPYVTYDHSYLWYPPSPPPPSSAPCEMTMEYYNMVPIIQDPSVYGQFYPYPPDMYVPADGTEMQAVASNYISGTTFYTPVFKPAYSEMSYTYRPPPGFGPIPQYNHEIM